MFGWHVRFDGLPGPKGIAIVYPHTSNWDFVLGLLAKWTLGCRSAGSARSRCSAA